MTCEISVNNVTKYFRYNAEADVVKTRKIILDPKAWNN